MPFFRSAGVADGRRRRAAWSFSRPSCRLRRSRSIGSIRCRRGWRSCSTIRPAAALVGRRAFARRCGARARARSRARWPRSSQRRRGSIASGSGRSRTQVKARTGQKGKALFHPIRIVLTGTRRRAGARSGGARDRSRRRAAGRCRHPEDSRLPRARRSIRACAGACSDLRAHRSTRSRGFAACVFVPSWHRDRVAHADLRHQSGSRSAARGAREGAARQRRAAGALADVVQAAERDGVVVRRVSPAELDRAARGGVHQGVVAEVEDADAFDVADLGRGAPRARRSSSCSTASRIPHNVGAILRTVDAAGADGVVRQSRHAAPLDGAAAKASAGAVAHVKVAEVVNIARALEELKEAGVWTVGLAGDSPKTITITWISRCRQPSSRREGPGCAAWSASGATGWCPSRCRATCQSLNVSVAAGVALFEAVRQRQRSSAGRSRPADNR